MKRASGTSFSASELNSHAATTKTVTAASVKSQAKVVESTPVASARWAVRGLVLSKRTSAMRLTVIAADRAEIMATTIHKICFHDGQPRVVKRAARSVAVS